MLLPVAESVRHWFASPRAAVGFLTHAAGDRSHAARRPPQQSACRASPPTVGEEIEALRRVAGDKAVKLIRREPDPAIIKIVDGWATDFEAGRAESLGFRAETSFDEIVRAHVEDELGGKIGG